MKKFLIPGIIFSAMLLNTHVLAKPLAPQETRPAEELASDQAALDHCRNNLQGIFRFMASRPDLFLVKKQDEKRMLTEQDKAVIRSTWQNLLDTFLAIEALKQVHASFYKLKPKDAEADSFFIFYNAFLTQYRFALEFLTIAENDPSFDIILNEPSPELGLPAGTYASFKFNFLNVAIASKFAALNVVYAYYDDPADDSSASDITQDKDFIWKQGTGPGEKMTAKNALNIVKKSGFSAWMPVQQRVAEWMGDTKVWRKDTTLISQQQIREILALLEPGDILFERREWHVSNVGLPGFWAHAAFFIGTPEEREEFFTGDDELCQWLAEQGALDCDFEKLLKTTYPEAYALGVTPQEEDHVPRILEAIGDGVSFTTIEHSASCDSLAVLRPRLSKKEKARAVLKAFKYSGRPYDFNFDFLTDASLVCSELIYKCYETANGFTGLTFPLQDMLGRKVTPPNTMVQQFDSEFNTQAQQTDFVLFYDGKERERTAVRASVSEFRKSWMRPKRHVLIKEANQKTSQR